MKIRKDINFTDAQYMREMHPETFDAPSYEELSRLCQGQYVKVCAFEERFWVQITHIDHTTNKVIGRVENDLMTRELHFGEYVEFHTHHIYNILLGSIL